MKLKSSIKDINEHLLEVTKYFYPFHLLFSPGSRVVHYFSSKITFHSSLSSGNENLYKHIQNLNYIFYQSQSFSHNIAVITDSSIKKFNIAIAIARIWKNNSITRQLKIQTINVTSIKAKLIAICIDLIPTIEDNNTHNIIVLTDSISIANKVLESYVNFFQNSIIPLTLRMKFFLEKDKRNVIHFWYYPSKAEWPRHKLVDDQVKAANNVLTLPSRNSFLFSRKKKCNNICKE